MNLTLRITLLHPPPGVVFRLQSGRVDLVAPTRETADAISFDFDVRVADGEPVPRFLGPFTQGPPATRFVYVNSGQAAGQSGTSWNRRAKIPLGSITWDLIEQAKGAVLEVQIEGTGRDGGPVCATVRLPHPWRVV